MCVKQTTVAQCKAYNTAGTQCAACNDGLYLSGNACVQISQTDQFKNCIDVNSATGKCKACRTGHALNPAYFLCTTPLDFVTAFCDAARPDGLVIDASQQYFGSCSVCADRAVGYQLNSVPICVLNAQLP